MNEDTVELLKECDSGIKMGVKSLHKYLNQYESADEKVKDIAKRLINIEEKLAVDIRSFL